jgi:hypothetical protein
VAVSPELPDGSNDYYLTPPGIQFTTTEGSTIMFRWNDENYTEYASTIHAPEGINVLRFYSEGPLGLKEEERSISFKVDTIDPLIDIETDPAEPDGKNGYFITEPKITISAVETGDKVYYDLGEGAAEYSEPLYLGSGSWELRYWGEDLAGRKSEILRKDILVDLSDPSISIRIDPQEPDGDGGYYITEPEITLLPEGASTGWFSVNGEEPSEYFTPFTLTDGEWEITYHATDPSGARSGFETVFLKVDTISPELSFSFDPPLVDGWVTKTTYLSLSTIDEKADILFTIGEEGPFEYGSDILLSDGEYNVRFWAVDPAGNIADGGERRVRIDTSSPVTEILLDRLPDSGNWYYDNPPGISFSTVSEPVSPETTYFSIGGGDFEVYTEQDLELEPGWNNIEFYTQDLAGNIEGTRTRDIGIDTSPPVPEFNSNRTLIPVRGPVRFSIEGSSDDIEVYRFRIDFGDGTVSEWIYGSEVTHDYTSLGKYEAVLTLEDIAGRSNRQEAVLLIEVLTQEEYDSRMEGDGPSVILIVLAATLVLLAILAISVLIFMFRRRRREGAVVIAEIEWEEEP